MTRDLSETAALFSDRARSAMLLALMDGRSLPAGQLALLANVAPQTASAHLSKLVQKRLLTVEAQGRHRYYRLANSEVAHAIEALLVISPQANEAAQKTARPYSPGGALAQARTCYSHLAGRLAVDIAAALESSGVLLSTDKRFAITPRGYEWFSCLGIEISERQANAPRFATRCLDWTERKPHIAGHLGSAMLARFRELKWIAPMRNSRAVRVTLEGERRLWQMLRVNGRCSLRP